MKPQLVQKPGAAAAKRTAARDAVVDEYGPLAIEVQTLSARLRVLTAETARYTILKDEIRSWFETLDPAGKFLYESDRNVVEISAKENEGVPDKPRLEQAIGFKRFLAACTITQKASKEQLQAVGKPGLFEKLWTWKRTGKRTINAIPKAAAEAA